jgi:hypothetical protein
MTGWFGVLVAALFVLGATIPGDDARELIAVAGVIAVGAVVSDPVLNDAQAKLRRRCLTEFTLEW